MLWPAGYASDYFVVEIEGYLEFAQGGFYTFFLSGGDEVRPCGVLLMACADP